MPDRKTRIEFLKTVHYEASAHGLDPQLVLGLIQVESGFRKYAVSSAGARGYMQVMPFWIKAIGEPQHNLFSLRTNLRYGCVILRHYLDDRERRLFPRARPLQRQPRPAGIPERGERRLAGAVEVRRAPRADMARLPLRANAALTNWFTGFTAPRSAESGGAIVLGHRRVYIVPSRLGLLFGGVLLILLIGSINYALSLGFALTFLLAGVGLAGMVQTTRNLARLAVQRRPRRAGLRRRARAVPAGARERRRVRPARDPAAPRRLGRAMPRRRAGRADRPRRCSRCPPRGAAGSRSGA